MKRNDYGEIIFSQDDIFDLTMQGYQVLDLQHVQVDTSVDVNNISRMIDDKTLMTKWLTCVDQSLDCQAWDRIQQSDWQMPEEYKNLDIAKHVLSLCQTDQQLQRCGQELLMYQEKNLFDLLRYLKYLVDVMEKNHVIWGVGRGSSVASYVLYLLKIHKIDSIYYDLDPTEFLR